MAAIGIHSISNTKLPIDTTTANEQENKEEKDNNEDKQDKEKKETKESEHPKGNFETVTNLEAIPLSV